MQHYLLIQQQQSPSVDQNETLIINLNSDTKPPKRDLYSPDHQFKTSTSPLSKQLQHQIDIANNSPHF